jgi:uncharacterized protein YukJ
VGAGSVGPHERIALPLAFPLTPPVEVADGSDGDDPVTVVRLASAGPRGMEDEMPLRHYGVLAGRVVDTRREGAAGTPHYQIRLVDGAGTEYRAAINVRSQQSPSELLYLVDDDFRHPLTDALPAPASGWTALPPHPGGANLDFIRGNLFDRADMRTLPPDAEGPDNDLADLLDHYVQRVRSDTRAQAYVYGQRFGPEPGTPDEVFGFRPGNGVHDVHMNQGNSGRFRHDDGVWQDGGMLLHFPDESRWVGIFLAFQSQAWHTDDVTGHALEGAEPPSGRGGARVRVVGALVGSAPGGEVVTLINASPDPVDLTGWRLADRAKHTCPVSAGVLAPGATTVVSLADGVHLGDDGGTITVLDAAGLKVHGVAYTGMDAHREGWTVVF